MLCGRQFAWLISGSFVPAVLWIGLTAPVVLAQQPSARPDARSWQPTVINRRSEPTALDTSDPTPDLRPTTPDTDPADIPFSDAGDDEQRPQIGRPVIVDGDPSWPPEPQAPRDGAPEPGPEDGAVQAIDPTRTDARDAEDIAAFERPAAGFDPDAFGVEIEPLQDRRPQRITTLDPFQPLGIRIGSFIIFPELETAAAGFSNVLRSGANPRGDTALEVRPTFRAVSNWRRHALEVRATGLATFHNEFPSEDDRAYALEARGRIDITRRTSIEATASEDVRQELRGALDATTATGPRADVSTSTQRLALNHRFNRLTIQLRGTLTEVDYAEPAGVVVTASGARDYIQQEIAARAQWQFKPELAAFVETAVNKRDHAAPAEDGFTRDSTGSRTRVGVSFGNTNQRLRGEISVGFGEQRPVATALPSIEGIIVDANVAVRFSALTSLLLTARSDIADSTTTGTSGAMTRSVGAELRHAFQRRLIGIAALRASRADYVGIQQIESEIAAELGLDYNLNRHLMLFARYLHTDFQSSDNVRSFQADEVRIGMRIRP